MGKAVHGQFPLLNQARAVIFQRSSFCRKFRFRMPPDGVLTGTVLVITSGRFRTGKTAKPRLEIWLGPSGQPGLRFALGSLIPLLQRDADDCRRPSRRPRRDTTGEPPRTCPPDGPQDSKGNRKHRGNCGNSCGPPCAACRGHQGLDTWAFVTPVFLIRRRRMKLSLRGFLPFMADMWIHQPLVRAILPDTRDTRRHEVPTIHEG